MFTPTVAYLGSGSQQPQQPWNPPPLYAVGSSESQEFFTKMGHFSRLFVKMG